MAKEEYAKKVVCKPGAKEYITHLFKGGKKLAVATSSDRELFMPTLEREGILNCFSEIVTVDEVKRGKGFPDIYEEAARRIHHEKKVALYLRIFSQELWGQKQGDLRWLPLKMKNLNVIK